MGNNERKLSDLLDDIGHAAETLEKAKYVADKIANYFDIILSSDNKGLILSAFNTQRTASNILEDYLCNLKEIIQTAEKVVDELHQEAKSRMEE